MISLLASIEVEGPTDVARGVERCGPYDLVGGVIVLQLRGKRQPSVYVRLGQFLLLDVLVALFQELLDLFGGLVEGMVVSPLVVHFPLKMDGSVRPEFGFGFDGVGSTNVERASAVALVLHVVLAAVALPGPERASRSWLIRFRQVSLQ